MQAKSTLQIIRSFLLRQNSASQVSQVLRYGTGRRHRIPIFTFRFFICVRGSIEQAKNENCGFRGFTGQTFLAQKKSFGISNFFKFSGKIFCKKKIKLFRSTIRLTGLIVVPIEQFWFKYDYATYQTSSNCRKIKPIQLNQF